MTDDIVTRLRRFCDGVRCNRCIFCDAASEIERSRDERDRWKHGAIHLIEIEQCSQVSCEQCADIFSAYEESSRG